MSKRSQLRRLAKLRQDTRWRRYRCIGDYHDGVYECDEVSPYAKSAGNINARIFVMLQDWASDAALRRPIDDEVVRLGHMPNLRTNRTLRILLKQVFALSLSDVYATNLFPFVKRGRMSAPIPMVDLVRAAQDFALPQIGIVKPELVICLGLATFNAICIAVGEKQRRPSLMPCDLRSGSGLQASGAKRTWRQEVEASRGTPQIGVA
jgi:hypothetical protein